MKQESLNEALDCIIKSIDASNINSTDKVELLLNLKRFLEDKNRYEKYLDTLMIRDLGSDIRGRRL